MGFELAKALEGTIWECTYDVVCVLHILDVMNGEV